MMVGLTLMDPAYIPLRGDTRFVLAGRAGTIVEAHRDWVLVDWSGDAQHEWVLRHLVRAVVG